MGVRAAATLCALALASALALQPARAARAPAARQHFPGAARGGGAVVLVSGATGRTGSLAYAALAARAGAAPLSTRALVRNATKAREVLGCGACTAAEGVFVGDVTGELPQEAFDGVDALIVATSSAPRQLPNGTWSYPKGGSPEDVDFRGTLNQVRWSRAAPRHQSSGAGGKGAPKTASCGAGAPSRPCSALGARGGVTAKVRTTRVCSVLSAASCLLRRPRGRR